MNQNDYYDSHDMSAVQSAFITKVFGWMAMALAITGVVALYTAYTPSLLRLIFGSRIVFYALVFGELGLVIYLSRAINRMSAQTATLTFIFYAILNGLTLASIFLVYTSSSIASTFFITAGTFGLMAFYGHVTKRDLTKMGSLLIMALVGVILASLVNIFFRSPAIYWITTYAGILIFVGLTAYDAQKIKNIGARGFAGEEMEQKAAVMGALSLYLDFINLFLYMLRILGRRK